MGNNNKIDLFRVRHTLFIIIISNLIKDVMRKHNIGQWHWPAYFIRIKPKSTRISWKHPILTIFWWLNHIEPLNSEHVITFGVYANNRSLTSMYIDSDNFNRLHFGSGNEKWSQLHSSTSYSILPSSIPLIHCGANQTSIAYLCTHFLWAHEMKEYMCA